MTLTESSIYISLKRLRRLLYSAQFGMTKGNRIVYGSPIMENIGKAISSYVLAFTVMEKKLEYIEEAIGWFAVERTDLEFCMDENIIHFQKRNVVPQKDENGNEVPIDPRDEVSLALNGKSMSISTKTRYAFLQGRTIPKEIK